MILTSEECTVLGQKSEQKPYGTLPENFLGLCALTEKYTLRIWSSEDWHSTEDNY